MYENESYDEYIRSILGYPNNYNMYNNSQDDYYMPYRNIQNLQNDELENCYPDIYKKVYPIIRNRCSQITEPFSRELIDNLTEDIYSNFEVNNNEVNLNINLQNDVSGSSVKQGQTRENRGGPSRETRTNESFREDRQIRNNLLRDLIRILILREFHNRPNRPPRPPFPGPRPGGFGFPPRN